jgi:REP element-mobilizing transposase RayT
LLANEAIHSAFKTIADRASNFGAWVGADVLMPDHVHLFVALDDEKLSLAIWMKSLKGGLSFQLRGASLPHIGRRDSLIISSAAVNHIHKNGTAFERTQSERVW